MNAYIASSWFNPTAFQEVEDIKQALTDAGFGYFSPKDFFIAPPTADRATQKATFDGNIEHLNRCEFMVCNTHGKDMGTIFEAGYFNCLGKPIVYFASGLKGQFNLMLAQSGVKVCTSIPELRDYLVRCRTANQVIEEEYTGLIE